MKTVLGAIILAGGLLAVTLAFTGARTVTTEADGLAASAPEYAGARTVTLEVRGMTCASCPYIVRQTLAAVDGVTAVEVSYEEKTAVVSFDDARTGVAALTLATTSVGFPSSLRERAEQ